MDMLSARLVDAAASDGQLLARIARGDQDAVTALYRRLERPLFAFLVKTLRDREAAADVLNETMLDVWRQAGRFEGKSSVATWIYSIAHHKAISWLRKRREVELDEEAVAEVADDATASQLLRGFHGVEFNSWRWTSADFTIAFRTPEHADRNGAWLSLKLTVPEASLKKLGSITLSAKIGGAAVGSETFTTSGNHEFRAEAPASAFKKETTEVNFSLDKSLPPNATDPRQLGVIVTSAALVAK